MCRWLVEDEDVEDVHGVLVRPPPAFDQPSAFDQQAFTEAVGIAIATIAQACAIVNQGRSNDIQRLEARHPPLGREGGVDDIRGIQDMGAGIKRK